jgi:hypothetical protein
MGDFPLPSLPPDFVPNFSTQPFPINNNTTFPYSSEDTSPLKLEDDTREERFPKDSDNDPTFLNELNDALKNLSQTNGQDWTLSREQWLESAALYSQAMVKGFIPKSGGLGAISLLNDLPLESRSHLRELAVNVEKLNRYFQIPYDEHTNINYCQKCLIAQGTTPTDWQTHFELCGYNATTTRESIHNQYIQAINTMTLEWYESQRRIVHEQVVLRITNDNFAPDLLTGDPRIREWSERVKEDARNRVFIAADLEAKIAAQDQFETALAQYKISHENDLSRKRDDLQHEFTQAQQQWQEELQTAKAQAHNEHLEKLAAAGNPHPLIVDPTARKKRRGSVSTINSPIITKSQPLQTTSFSTVPDSANDITVNPTPATAPVPTLTTQQDVLTQILNTMNKQFDNLTNRLDKLEAGNKDAIDYNTWGTCAPTTWEQSKDVDPLAKIEDQYENIDYDNHEFYDDPPNDPSFLGQEGDRQSNPDTDCILLSGPPTPTANPITTTTTGLRPPERAQRVDFISTKLATDSFGLPVGGRCNADGTISYSNENPTRTKKPKKAPIIPQHMTPYTDSELQTASKDAIISHAMFAYQHRIGKGVLKAQAIQQYKIAAANALKPGARQSTLSFANVTSTSASPQTNPIRQTTPSAWSKSPSPPPKRNTPPSGNTTWTIRPRMGTSGLASRPFNGDADKLTEWYRQRLQANAGSNKPALTLLRGSWATGPKSIFALTFAGHVTYATVRAYTALFLEQFDCEHIFHPGGNALKKIALFNIPLKHDNLGNPQTRRNLFDELIRGGSLAGLHLYDGPTWTHKASNPDATSGTAHILVYDPTGSAVGKFFNKQTFMYNKRIASQIAIPPKPFIQCTRCHRLGHKVDICKRPSNVQICHHCGSNSHASNQHKFQCKEQHSGPTCDCPPRCFLCRNARKSPAQFTGHTSLDTSCPLRRYLFTLSDPTNANPIPTNV